MNAKKVEVTGLINGWKDLRRELERTKKINFGTFVELFSQTFALLSQHAAKETVSKINVSLVAEAYLYANADTEGLDSKHLATMVLTERMLACCAFSVTPSVQGGAYVYIFEARRDVFIDFAKAAEAVAALEKVFEEKYWKGY